MVKDSRLIKKKKSKIVTFQKVGECISWQGYVEENFEEAIVIDNITKETGMEILIEIPCV